MFSTLRDTPEHTKRFTELGREEKGKGGDRGDLVEKRRGTKETAVARKIKGRIKRRETDPASNQFPRCSPQPRTPTEVHRVTWRREEGRGR